MGRYIIPTNEMLDRIDFEAIKEVEKFDDISSLCSYGLIIKWEDREECYLYYVKWQRNKDYKRMFILKKKKEERNANCE